LTGDIPEALYDEVNAWIESHKNVKMKQLVHAMAELWLQVPEKLQALLLFSKPDTAMFQWAANEVGDNLLTWEESFDRQNREASTCVRRMLLLIQDYAVTRSGIRTLRDLKIALKAIHDLLEWVDFKSLEGSTETDQLAVQHVVDAVAWWQSTGTMRDIGNEALYEASLRSICEGATPEFKARMATIVAEYAQGPHTNTESEEPTGGNLDEQLLDGAKKTADGAEDDAREQKHKQGHK